MKVLVLSGLLLSCAKLGYIIEQAQGQFSLLYQGEKNEKVLADPEVDEKIKHKIRVVQKAKKFFYHYFNKREEPIYNKTTLLNRDAVTYLVIASPKDKIEPIRHHFPIVGSFPYLGFFSLKSAKKHEAKMQKNGYATYLRNVYAYSSLGNFNDRILSSFFHYSDNDLSELVFHELVHTIFFVKNEVSFNENMANFFAEKLLSIYLGEQIEKIDYTPIYIFIVEEVKKLNSKYSQKNKEPNKVLDEFLLGFKKRAKAICYENNIKNCWPLKVKNWNNARFAALMTYNEGQSIFNKLYDTQKIDLKGFLINLEDQYKEYRKQSEYKLFYDYLEKGI